MSKNDHIQGILFGCTQRLYLDEDASIKSKVNRISRRLRTARQTTRERIFSYYPIPVVEHHGFLSNDDVSEIFGRLRFEHPIHRELEETQYTQTSLAFPGRTSYADHLAIPSILERLQKNRRLY